MEKLFLLDAYALIYRAYYALIRAPRITSKGFNTSAIFGFCNTLDEILRKENPSHIAVCFDPHGPTFRHEMYPEYKANREAQPEDIGASVPIIKDIVEAYSIPIFEVPGYEADDVIGTLATEASRQGFTTYMMTPDKDYGQLVTDSIFMYKPSLRGQGFELRGPKEVCEKYGIQSPIQVIDLLALEGDTIDNIPGCPGVGPKTAAKLIAEFSSVENLLDHASEIKGAIGEKIRNNAQNIRFSKQLATIKTDVPLEVDFNNLRRDPEDIDRLREIFTDLEFKTFLQRLNTRAGANSPSPSSGSAPSSVPYGSPSVLSGSAPSSRAGRVPAVAPPGSVPYGSAPSVPSGSAPSSRVGRVPAVAPPGSQPSLFDFMDGEAPETPSTVDTFPADYKPITSPQELGRLVEEAASSENIGLALYAIGAEAMTAQLRAIAVSLRPGHARFIDIPTRAELRQQMMQLLEPLFTSPSTTLVSHDIKRDIVLLRREKIEIESPYFDTQLAHYLLQPEMRHRLADIVMNLLKVQMADFAVPIKPFAPLPAGQEVDRLCQQADMTLRLRQPLTDLLSQNGQLKLLNDIELPLAVVLADMEWDGVRIDTAELNRLSVNLTGQLHSIEEEAYELAGEKFNISSPMQVGEILFGKFKLDPKAKRTKTGAYSTTEEILLKHRADHPLVELIIRARGLKKLLATYVDALPELVNPNTGKIHTTFNQTVTATGRISSANPNLQNIPIRTDDGKEVRRAFIPDPGNILLSADYSQIELRLLANLSDDPELTEAFTSGLDIHRATAAKIYHLPYEEVSDDQRRKAKTANFGTVYGISAFGLAERLNIPRSEAKELIEGYFATYPHIKEYIARQIERAKEDGYVTTIMGRKRYLPDINSRNATVRSFAERNAVNAPLQGSAADIIKLAMIRIHDEMRRLGLRSQMTMQVHDELVFNVVPDELPQLQALVVKEMEAAYRATVPLEVSAGTGLNWLEAH